MAPAYGDQPQIDMERTQQRLQEMQSIMNKADSSHGEERRQLMKKHMQLMHEQMQDMHHIMDHENTISQGNSTQDTQQWMQNMEQRMDVMQQMMEQIIEQEEIHTEAIESLSIPPG
jgi:hypothetical protein